MNSRGVSTVIGTILLLALTVLFSFVIISVLHAPLPSVAPDVGTASSIDVEERPGEDVQVLSIKNMSGDEIYLDEIELQIRSSNSDVTLTSSSIRDTPATADGKWSPGETLIIELSTNGVCLSEGDSLEYVLTHEPSNQAISVTDVDVRKDFEFTVISDTEIQSAQDYTAEVQLLRTSLSGTYRNYLLYGPVTASIKIDDTYLTPWPDGDTTNSIDAIDDNLNDPTRSETYSYTSEELVGGTTTSVSITSWYGSDYEYTGQRRMVDGEYYYEYRPTRNDGERIRVDTSDSDESNIVLLRDGEQVPDFKSAGAAQQSLDVTLGERVSDDGTLQLADNEVVALAELSEENANPGDASVEGDPDYNDAVFLITLSAASAGDVEDADQPNELICSSG